MSYSFFEEEGFSSNKEVKEWGITLLHLQVKRENNEHICISLCKRFHNWRIYGL